MISHSTISRRAKKMASIYFAQMPAGGPIKIGTAIKPRQRLLALQKNYGNSLRFLAVVPGRPVDECTLHKIFAADFLVDEWFSASLHLTAFIEMVAKIGEIPMPYRWEAPPGAPIEPRRRSGSTLSAKRRASLLTQLAEMGAQ